VKGDFGIFVAYVNFQLALLRRLQTHLLYLRMIGALRTNLAWRGKPSSFEVAFTSEPAALRTLSAGACIKARAANRASEWNYIC